MQGIHHAESPDKPRRPAPPGWPLMAAPPDWPPPGGPLPGDEPTMELPIIAALAEEPAEPASEPVAGVPGRRWLIGAGVAAVALLLTGATVIVVSRDTSDGGQWAPPAAAAAAAENVQPVAENHTATAARDGRTEAGFDLLDGAAKVSLRAADLGDDLYRISTPAGDPGVPRVEEQDGRVRLRLGNRADAVDIALSTRVRWDLRVAGGAELSTIDLTGGRIGGVDLTGGATRINLTLPRPDGTLNVRMTGGVNLFDVRTTGGVPVRVRVGSGAAQVTLDGRRHQGVAAGSLFTPELWAEADNRIDVDAAAGMATLTVAPY